MVGGPNYETVAELKMLRELGIFLFIVFKLYFFHSRGRCCWNEYNP